MFFNKTACPDSSGNMQKKGNILFGILLASLFFTNKIAAQYCSMACDNSVNISLPASCEAEVRYDMILEGTYNSNNCSPNGPQAFQVIVMGPTGTPIPTSPFVTSSNVGHAYTVKVKHWASGNSCWGNIYVQDELMPDLSCPPDITVACTESTSVAAAGTATATDCSGFTIEHYDDTQNFGCASTAGRVVRTWTATDEYNNSNSCLQTINIALPSSSQIEWPPNRDDISAPSIPCSNPNTSLANTGVPTINGQPIPSGTGYCNMALDHTDQTLELCENSFKILRRWTLVYWCTGEILYHTQVIAVMDKTPPTLTCPQAMTVGTTSSVNCEATVILPQVGISDDCSTNFSVAMNTPAGWVNGNGGVINGVGLGTYPLTYNVSDDCGNAASCSTQLTVEDDDAPTVVCDEFTVTTLNSSGIALVYASTFDDGSYDNCGYITLDVRRMEAACGNQPAFGPSVIFCCEDVGDDVQVEMRATDFFGNSNSCMVTVHVDDNSEPAILCPANITLTCQQDPTDLGLTGEPTTSLACGSANVTFSDTDNLNLCNVGNIIRHWTATAGNGNSNACNQTITLYDNTPVSIDFPDDYAVTGCVSIEDLAPENLPAGFDFPVVTDDCELIATNVSDQVFTVAAPACFKIARTWTLIDWCTHQTGGSTGIWTHTQIIMVTDNDAPVFTCPDDIVVGVGPDCKGTVLLPQITDIQDCSEDVTVFLSTALGAGYGPFSNVETGQYTATYTVADGCNNSSSCTINIEVKDDKKPTPYCKSGLVIELSGVDTDGDGLFDDGMGVTWASDLNDNSFDNCPGTLKYSFSSDISIVGDTFYCGDLGQNLVQVWVTDASGNQDFCETAIIVQDNMGLCNGSPLSSVGGAITNEGGLNVENVTVSVNGSSASSSVVTGPDGNFEFPALPMGGDFTVSPEKDMGLLNGVTTYDIVLIRKHILGVAALGSPYKIIAADINRSNSVTTYDLVELQRNILLVSNAFPNNHSWRFVDAGYVFPNPADPFEAAFPEIYNINNFPGNMDDVDFMAIKIGDVNGSASPNMLHEETDERSGGTLVLKVENKNLKPGAEVKIDFTSENFEQIIGYQFTLGFDPAVLEYKRLEKGELPSLAENNFGFALLQQGAITTSWYRSEPVSLEKGAVLFSLVFQAKTNTDWARALRLGSTYTSAEAYHDDGGQLDVELVFAPPSTPEVNSGSTVFVSVFPNPFHKTTVIGFALKAAQDVTLTVFDLSGRVAGSVSGFYQKGAVEMEFTADEGMRPGAYFYRLETSEGVKTGKLIYVK
ncbi:MAG TPA: T9SS type A sorting domain-containing protein [Bacteroidetes bacterium]|nr:T9SS type A sorting domain-containing protein [Bacteroidota bacterium]